MHKKTDKKLYDIATMEGYKYEGNWGVVVFILGVILLWCGYWLCGFLPQKLNPVTIKKLFSYIGILTGAGALSVGYLSYPRIHNLKVFLAGHLTGLSALAFSIFSNSGIFSLPASSSFIPAIYFFMLMGIFASTLLPTFLKYRWTKRITIAALLIETVFLFLFWRTSSVFFSLEALRKNELNLWLTLVPGVVTFLTLFFSIFVLKRQFFLGGVLGGMTLFFGVGWYLSNARVNISIFDSYVFAAAPFFLIIGVFVHWLARMEHRASYDPLLRIYNRSHCERILEEQTNIDTNPPFGIAIVDIDRFKSINDKYGHRAGDEVLVQLVRILTNEIVPDGIICRYGGEEFAVFFPRQSTTRVKMIMEIARKAVRKAVVRFEEKRIRITISVGISHRQNSSQTLHEVFRAADKALYRAKKEGRNQVRFSKTE
jgi:diguanylate cyclase (GGDEF)-like protein